MDRQTHLMKILRGSYNQGVKTTINISSKFHSVAWMVMPTCNNDYMPIRCIMFAICSTTALQNAQHLKFQTLSSEFTLPRLVKTLRPYGKVSDDSQLTHSLLALSSGYLDAIIYHALFASSNICTFLYPTFGKSRVS